MTYNSLLYIVDGFNFVQISTIRFVFQLLVHGVLLSVKQLKKFMFIGPCIILIVK